MSASTQETGISPLANQVLKPSVKWLPFQREQATGVALSTAL